VALIPAPVSTIRCEMRWPWLDTIHFSVSHQTTKASATATPGTACIRSVRPTTRSAFSANGTSEGCSAHWDSQCAGWTGTSARSFGGPATVDEARATPAAASPARRAANGSSSDVAKKPHAEPIRARIPSPADSSWRSSSTAALRARRRSVRPTMARASA
jgi:hypothetical protein